MREISTKKIEIGEHVMIDGVEYVAEKAGLLHPCERCAFDEGSELCSNFIECDGIIFKKVKKKPSYRPYKDTDELIADCESRFNKISAANSMPLIWVMNDKVKAIITDYAKYAVSVFGAFHSLETLYKEFTYLDGSPCGKEVTP